MQNWHFDGGKLQAAFTTTALAEKNQPLELNALSHVVPYFNLNKVTLMRREGGEPAKKGEEPECKRAGVEGYSLRGINAEPGGRVVGTWLCWSLFAQALQAWENHEGCQETQNLLWWKIL